jgi:hypothetical protein
MPEQAKTIKAIFEAIKTEFPQVEIAIASRNINRYYLLSLLG